MVSNIKKYEMFSHNISEKSRMCSNHKSSTLKIHLNIKTISRSVILDDLFDGFSHIFSSINMAINVTSTVHVREGRSEPEEATER